MIIGSWFLIQDSTSLQQKGLIKNEYEHLGGDFTLKNAEGTPISLSDFQGKIVLLTFGYTSCPDVCALVVHTMGQIVKRLDQEARHIQGLFITFDPERDTPEQLDNYVTYFHPSFIGLTEKIDKISEVTDAYGALFIQQETESALGTLYAHTDYIYAIDTQGKIRHLFKQEMELDELVSKVKQMLPSS